MFKPLLVKSITVVLLFLSFVLHAQEKSKIHGKVTDKQGHPLEGANIIIKGFIRGTASLADGNYQITIPSNRKVVLQFTHLNFQLFEHEFFLKPGEEVTFNPKLSKLQKQLSEVKVDGSYSKKNNLTSINSRLLKKIPVSGAGAIEQLVKTMPGVSSNNELSSQYSVRGGNFDENLVYVNDIEIYRPYLIRSGQQEGLSFTNPDLVSSIRFSSGGFDAAYGNKMSSVLDIKYKEPASFEASGTISFLGASAHFANRSDNRRFSYICGFRYKTNRYFLNSLNTKGNYTPRYTDFQGLINYRFGNSLSLHFLGSISKNRYLFEPESRETTFGTISSALQLRIFFDGQEKDEYLTDLEAVTLKYHPNSDNLIKIITSRYRSREEESFDILGQYFLHELFVAQNGPSNEHLENLGVGGYLNHARNELKFTVNTLAIKGSHNVNEWFLQWGIEGKHERIRDVINEWQYIDSAGYSVPFSSTEVLLASSRNSRKKITMNHLGAFMQGTYSLQMPRGEFQFTGGLRHHYWDYLKKNIFSPRFSINYLPAWKRKFRFRLSSGYYQQLPSYREMLTLDGSISPNVIIQKSIHYILGQEYYFSIRTRPFRFSTEIYYKYLQSLIPYEIDNVRLRYYGNQRSKGYATGIDFRLNGEFIPGTESWASLSVMKTEEDLAGDELGYIPRPADQRINFSMFFQDYLPKNPSYKMQFTLVYGGRLPFWSPKTGKQGPVFKMPPYRRVDLGFAKVLTNTDRKKNPGVFRHLESLWLGIEIFNLLNINNTVSYLWINDVHYNQYAVPNYLTSRKINFKLSARF